MPTPRDSQWFVVLPARNTSTVATDPPLVTRSWALTTAVVSAVISNIPF
ncbi:MAG TPA: hypothetical protein VH063_06585 [Gaiellaceae bacterium]|jgi:hypothetical protein|nr:hypothetical protein [Gaiellaceae bacterium]